MRAAFIVLGAAGVLGAAACDLWPGVCSCVPEGFALSLPCPAAAAQIESIEATGACQGATINDHNLPEIWVTPTKEGACHLVLHFRDGSSFSVDPTIKHSQGCCAGYRAEQQFIEVPREDACPDAGTPDTGGCGTAPQPAGCFTMPEWDECNCHCKGLDVPTAGAQSPPGRQCTRACACGFDSLVQNYGCTTDADCKLVRADCCGCSNGGVSTAVLGTNATAWESAMTAHCGPTGTGESGCSTIFLCGQAKAVCDRGHCLVQ